MTSADGGVHRTLARRARTLGWVSLVAVLLALSMRTNPLELFRSISSPVTLSVMVVLCTVPFLGSGVVIGTALAAWSKDAGKVYAADLVGGGIAGASCVGLIPYFGGLGLLGLATVLLAVSGVLFGWLTPERNRTALVTGAMTLACFGLMRDEDAWIVPAPTKELTLFHRPEIGLRVIEHRAWTPHGRIGRSETAEGAAAGGWRG